MKLLRTDRIAARSTVVGAVCLATLLLLSAPAFADDGGMRFEIGPQIGVAGFALNSGLGNAQYRYDVPSPAFAFGLRASARIKRQFAIDLWGRYSAGSFRKSEDFENPGNEDNFAFYKPGGDVNVMGLRLLARYNFEGNETVVPFLTLGGGVDTVSSDKSYEANGQTYKAIDSDDMDTALQAGVGANIKLTHSVRLRIDANYFLGEAGVDRPGQEKGSATHNYEILAGVIWVLGGPPGDSDNDGLADDKDKCPDQAEDKDGFKDTDGCPDPDNDGDGVPDTEDKCRNQAEDKDGFKDYDGCPEPDNDNDGVLDAKDRCPNKPEDRDGFYDKDGCPDLDNDKDGIPDAEDKCPNKAEDLDHFKDTDGCPEYDNDRDGVKDKQDKCPRKPETRNGYQDEDGCPDSFPEEVKAFTSKPVEGFVFGRKHEFKAKKSKKAVQAVLKVLNAHPKMNFEMHCHADVKPAKKSKRKRRRKKKKKRAALSPQDISVDRCEALHEHFVSKGVKASRLKIKARGNSQQLVPTEGLKRRKLKKALRQNNRIEFKLSK